MKILRCLGMLSLCILSACNKAPPPVKPAPAPAQVQLPTQPVELPKVPEAVARVPAAPAETTGGAPTTPTAQVPPVPDKPLIKPTPAVTVRAPVSVPKNTPAPVKSKRRAEADVVAAPLPKTRLNLNLPPELARQAEPKGKVEPLKNDSVLPPMFVEKNKPQTPFQLNGKLLTNELSRDNRKDVDGAALEFEFKQ